MPFFRFAIQISSGSGRTPASLAEGQRSRLPSLRFSYQRGSTLSVADISSEHVADLPDAGSAFLVHCLHTP